MGVPGWARACPAVRARARLHGAEKAPMRRSAGSEATDLSYIRLADLGGAVGEFPPIHREASLQSQTFAGNLPEFHPDSPCRIKIRLSREATLEHL